MGNLVFQATLGGQVNLVGPNTASTFNLNVPAVSSTIATTSGTETLTNKTLTNPVINGFTGDTSVVNIGSNQFYKDTSGNIGIGVVPSAWSANRLTLQIGGSSGGYVTANNGLAIASNYYYSSGDKFVANGYAPLYYMSSGNGQHQWYTSNNNSSGAGAAVSLTQAMTLDASGNLGLGTTSPDDITSGYTTVDVRGSTGGGLRLGVAGGNNMAIYASSTTSVIEAAGSAALQLVTNGSERARIDSSGNLLVGSTSPIFSYSKTVQVTAANGSVPYSCVNSGYAARTWKFGAEGVGGAYIVFNGSDVGAYISYGGTSWTATSDERLKTDLVPIENAAQKVSTLRAVTGRYKTDDETVSRAFLIAQDVQAVLPQAVTEQGDENKTLGLAYSEVIPLLVAAIKEQQAIIETLTSRIAALENK